MLLSSGVVWRHREWDDFRSECPGGRRGAAAARLGAARRRARLARVARRRAGLDGDRKPAHRRAAVRPARADGAARARRRAGDAAAGRRADRRSCSPAAASRSGSPRSRACCCGRTRGATARRSISPAPAEPRSPPGSTSSTAARCPRRRRGSARRTSSRSRSSTGAGPVSSPTTGATSRRLGVVVGERPGAGDRAAPHGRAWYVLDEEALANGDRGRTRPTWSRRRGRPAEPSSIRTSCRSRRRRRRGSPCTWPPPSRTRSAACGSTPPRASSARTAPARRALGGRRRRGRHRHRRLRERPRPGARPRSRRRGIDRALAVRARWRDGHLIFVWKTSGYELAGARRRRPAASAPSPAGRRDDARDEVAPSPLPGDRRQCAYLVRTCAGPSPTRRTSAAAAAWSCRRRRGDGERGAERPRPLLQHLDRAAAALARRVVVDRHLDRVAAPPGRRGRRRASAGRGGSRPRTPRARSRTAPPASARPSTSAAATSISTRTPCSIARSRVLASRAARSIGALRERAAADRVASRSPERGAPTGSRLEREVAQLADRRPRARAPAPSSAPRCAAWSVPRRARSGRAPRRA